MADMTGLVALVTGANTGIGLQTAIQLARRSPRLLVVTGALLCLYNSRISLTRAARNAQKCEQAKNDITQQSGFKDVLALPLDLDRTESIVAFKEQVASQVKQLDIVIANAGLERRTFERAPTGHEQVMQTNFYGTFLFLSLLWPVFNKDGRALVVSSDYAAIVPSLPLGQGLLARLDSKEETAAAEQSSDEAAKQLSIENRYAVSKLLQSMLVDHIAGKSKTSNVSLAAVCPGLVKSNLYRDFGEDKKDFLGYLNSSGLTPAEGAQKVLAPLDGNLEAGRHYSSGWGNYPSKFALSSEGRQLAADVCDELKADLSKVKGGAAIFN